MATIYFNENPCGKAVGDCVIRALSLVLDQAWDEIYISLAVKGLLMCDMMSSNRVWGAYLRERGFTRHVIPYDDYTVEEFCYDHPIGVYVVGTGVHAVAIIDGIAYDADNSSYDTVQYYYVREW